MRIEFEDSVSEISEPVIPKLAFFSLFYLGFFTIAVITLSNL